MLILFGQVEEVEVVDIIPLQIPAREEAKEVMMMETEQFIAQKGELLIQVEVVAVEQLTAAFLKIAVLVAVVVLF